MLPRRSSKKSTEAPISAKGHHTGLERQSLEYCHDKRALAQHKVCLWVAVMTVGLLIMQVAPPALNSAPYLAYQVRLPLISRYVVPAPNQPALLPINNSDHDRFYSVFWGMVPAATSYTLEEATRPDFSDARVVYDHGFGDQWAVPAPGKTPKTYYYRVKATGVAGDSLWSPIQSVRIFPLHVGLQSVWSGAGYIRLDEYSEVSTYLRESFNVLTDPDVIRAHVFHTYEPNNPHNWPNKEWHSFYSVTTGNFLSSSTADDPAWQWGASRYFPNTFMPADGQQIRIGNVPFTTSGPYQGTTPSGRLIAYWKFTNLTTFTMWSDGGEWTQRVEPGQAVLHYDAGPSHLRTYRRVTRRFYYNGAPTGYTVSYVDYLTHSTSFDAVETAQEQSIESLSLPVENEGLLTPDLKIAPIDPASLLPVPNVAPNFQMHP